MSNSWRSRFGDALKYSGLPLLAAIYPAAFHYANNAHLVLFSSFLELSVFLAGVGLLVYLFLALFTRGKYPQSAVGAGVILAFFHTYGPVFDGLRSLDILQVETYSVAPFYVFVAVYVGWRATRIRRRRSTQIWNVTGLILAALVLLNVLKVVPIEVDKSRETTTVNAPIASNNPDSDKQYPDIYYLIFDEAASFEAVRQYWNYKGVDDFVAFLKASGFYVAEVSHGGSTHTLREIATRLNYEEYPIGGGNFEIYDVGIAHSRVMDYLRAHGYTLIAYDERRTAYPTSAPMPADYLIEKPPERVGSSSISLMDEYKFLALQSTLLRPYISVDPNLRQHLNMIVNTTEAIASAKFPSPKFVYAHLMLPHVPFAFTEGGGVVSVQPEYFNWQRYLDNYKFFLQVARKMVRNILASANPENPPVIIVQSDHGARNLESRPYAGNLEDYSEEYKTWIVNAVFLPDCEDAPLTQDMDPVNTFPVVFNCYFDANIRLK